MMEYQPWHPMKDAVDLKHLGKLSEELGECIAVISRIIIQGLNEVDPHSGKLNKLRLEEEMADIAVNFKLVVERFDLNMNMMETRVSDKENRLRKWHADA